MKKILLVAASAMMVFASCTKVNVNYPDNGQPQEIAMFAVNKNMTKAPVAGATFDGGDNMRVSAYLAAVQGGTCASYFENILFSKGSGNETNWVAGQYWPISASTLNFVAVTQKGGGVDLTYQKIEWDDKNNKFTVTVDYNKEAVPGEGNAAGTPQTTNQSDIMYACARASNVGNGTSTPPAVVMKFNHALAWINFAFKSNVTEEGELVINSVELYAPYNGELTVTPTNYKETDNTNKPLGATPEWALLGFLNLKVTDQNDAVVTNVDLANKTDFTHFGSMLVVPNSVAYTETEQLPYFVINYTIKQGETDKTYSYKHDLSSAVWEMGKKYTYNISITLHEIKVNPSVENWGNEAATPVPLG